MKTDKQKVNRMFAMLRSDGYIAKQNFMCCSSCALAELEHYPPERGVVFYHKQDCEGIFQKNGMLRGWLNIRYAGSLNGVVDSVTVARSILAAAYAVGLSMMWDGNTGTTIRVR